MTRWVLRFVESPSMAQTRSVGLGAPSPVPAPAVSGAVVTRSGLGGLADCSPPFSARNGRYGYDLTSVPPDSTGCGTERPPPT